MSAKLTDGQQGVIAMYDTEIKHAKRERAYEESELNFGEAYRWTLKIEELEAERAATLEKFLTPEPPLPAVFTEPQTAAYQAAVDNVWFEIEAAARNIKSTWFIRDEERYDDRVDYVVDLQQQMKRALGTNGRDLAYRIRN